MVTKLRNPLLSSSSYSGGNSAAGTSSGGNRVVSDMLALGSSAMDDIGPSSSSVRASKSGGGGKLGDTGEATKSGKKRPASSAFLGRSSEVQYSSVYGSTDPAIAAKFSE